MTFLPALFCPPFITNITTPPPGRHIGSNLQPSISATITPRTQRYEVITAASMKATTSTTTRTQRHKAITITTVSIAFASQHTMSARALSASRTCARRMRVVTVPEYHWRTKALEHSDRVRTLLAPGMTGIDHPMNSGRRRQLRHSNAADDLWTALDPKNPVYNFLIEYYGLKGAKGPRRLARWSPDPSLLLCDENELDATGMRVEEREINHVGNDNTNPFLDGGILLEGATEDDFAGTLHLKGAVTLADGSGTVYSPSLFYSRYSDEDDACASSKSKMKSAAPFQWYRSILINTLNSEPIFHCHGLHEWAMQYHPPGAEPPPSGKYQSHMPLRVSREVINEAVERRGIHCTHVDALRFFAPAAAPLNHHGSQLERTDQLRLEQKGCVHAHMDLLKIGSRLQPFVDSTLVADALDIALRARRLDIEASPYDVRSYGLGVVPVETSEGREEYRRRQKDLMKAAAPVREKLLGAYDAFLGLAFDDETLAGANRSPAAERFAKAEPGGKPWRKNLIEAELAA